MLEISFGLRSQRKRSGGLARRRQPLPRRGAELGDILGVRVGANRFQVVRGQHLGDVPGLAGPGLFEVASGRQVLGLARLAPERAVGDRAQQRLYEDVLSSLGRAGILVTGHYLFAHKASEEFFHL